MRNSTTSLAFAGLLAAQMITIAPSDAAGRDAFPMQAELLFQARMAWFQDDDQRRLDLLQSHQLCVDAAASANAIKTCPKT